MYVSCKDLYGILAETKYAIGPQGMSKAPKKERDETEIGRVCGYVGAKRSKRDRIAAKSVSLSERLGERV